MYAVPLPHDAAPDLIDTEQLLLEIQRAYPTCGNHQGWRLLYSPVKVIQKASVALIGLNPGGSEQPDSHSEFAMPVGMSAYRDEVWKPNYKAGQEPLQRQILALFNRLNVQPQDVLAGNLVPWRSPSWSTLNRRAEALEFGIRVWKEILLSANPTTIVAIGNETGLHLAALLGIASMTKVPVGWGSVCGSFGSNDKQRLVCLPHLSRFQIITKAESQEALVMLFGERWLMI